MTYLEDYEQSRKAALAALPDVLTERYAETRALVHATLAQAAGFMHAATGDYPYRDGPVTVIGPECFTDGEVLSYRGDNYVRQDAIHAEISCGARHDGAECNLPTGHSGSHTGVRGPVIVWGG